MKRLSPLLGRLGPRLFLSYVILSAAAATTGLVAALLVPPEQYQGLMLQVMHPPRGATLAEMDAVLARAISSAIVDHVVLSLAVAITVSLALAAYVSMAIGASLARVTDATRRLASGAYEAQLRDDGIAEIAELGRNVNVLAASLAKARERRHLAVASISHELRTPLTALRAYVDAMREGVMAPTGDVIERMALSVERLERMATDLTELSQTEEGLMQDFHPESLEVSRVLEAACDVARAAYERQEVHLIIDTPPSGFHVWADPIRLGEVLDNILANSLAHTPSSRSVTLGGGARGEDHVQLWVADEGEGIPADDLPHVIEPFYRGAGSAGRTSRPGMGLGLAICSDFVKAMGGRMVIESPGHGHGTRVIVILPKDGRHLLRP